MQQFVVTSSEVVELLVGRHWLGILMVGELVGVNKGRREVGAPSGHTVVRQVFQVGIGCKLGEII